MKKKIPMRRCIGCMDSKPKKELIRIVTTSQGDVKVDSTGKVNGRGFYVCANENCINAAKQKNFITKNNPIRGEKDKINQLYEELLTYAKKNS